MRLIEKFNSENAIKVVSLLELILYIFFFYRGLRGVIMSTLFANRQSHQAFISYCCEENGWTFIFTLLLIISIVLTFTDRKKIAWVLKLTTLLSYTLFLFLMGDYLSAFTLIIFLFYTIGKISSWFKILPQERKKLIIKITIASAILLLFASFLDFLQYPENL